MKARLETLCGCSKEIEPTPGCKAWLMPIGRGVEREFKLQAVEGEGDSMVLIYRETGEIITKVASAKPAQKPEPVCSRCNDTHVMPWNDETQVMCTSCPTPCQLCRSGGNGPYCEKTPCSCACHARRCVRCYEVLEVEGDEGRCMGCT